MTPQTVLKDLIVERPVAGGRMLARHEGRVVFVSGAIPGERIHAVLERAAQQVLWARAVDIIEPSGDRREPLGDPTCGGLTYAHIVYERQRQLKAAVLVDAFRRVGKITLDVVPPVLPSPEAGYRWRARLHVRDHRAGFFKEQTHRLCEPAPGGPVRAETLDAVSRMLRASSAGASACEALVVAENGPGLERVVHLEPREGSRLDDAAWGELPAGITGMTTTVRQRTVTLAGSPRVTDTASQLWGAESSPLSQQTMWTRSAASFFQGNRYLTGTLVRHVLLHASASHVADLYAGVGLFAVALASNGTHVVAVENDPQSGTDLDLNAAPWASYLETVHASVEEVLPELQPGLVGAVVMDPPRAGLSRRGLSSLMSLSVPRLIYVSCDPATLARDAALLVAGGYGIRDVTAFDLFPTTAHVETVVIFERDSSN
ncbi:MAG: hypothetical protein ABI051_06175 [Vicinamibacterales bacterium]